MDRILAHVRTDTRVLALCAEVSQHTRYQSYIKPIVICYQYYVLQQGMGLPGIGSTNEGHVAVNNLIFHERDKNARELFLMYCVDRTDEMGLQPRTRVK